MIEKPFPGVNMKLRISQTDNKGIIFLKEFSAKWLSSHSHMIGQSYDCYANKSSNVTSLCTIPE